MSVNSQNLIDSLLEDEDKALIEDCKREFVDLFSAYAESEDFQVVETKFHGLNRQGVVPVLSGINADANKKLGRVILGRFWSADGDASLATRRNSDHPLFAFHQKFLEYGDSFKSAPVNSAEANHYEELRAILSMVVGTRSLVAHFAEDWHLPVKAAKKDEPETIARINPETGRKERVKWDDLPEAWYALYQAEGLIPTDRPQRR